MAGGEWHMMVGLCDVNLGGFQEGESSEPVPVRQVEEVASGVETIATKAQGREPTGQIAPNKANFV
jgi:hypothetical protein